MESELVKKIISVIKALKCKFKCCSGTSCQLGEYPESGDPNVETRDFEEI